MPSNTPPQIFTFPVETANGPQNFSVEAGTSLIFVGANGSGKSRLAVTIDSNLGAKGHRISAHRALMLNTDVPKIKEDAARRVLKYGLMEETAKAEHKMNHRWGGGIKKERIYTHLLNDFDSLLQTLFAEQSNTALNTHNRVRIGDKSDATPTLFERLKNIWQALISHRELIITGDDIMVSPSGGNQNYSASAMSDGERAIFYLIGQALCAEPDSVLIIDEPELHIHRSIMSKLWDSLEAERPDCAFIFITHDLEFASARIGHKFIIINYTHPGMWDFEEVPENTGFSEKITTLILGSRRPILFVEGSGSSLDTAVYRNRYPEWTVVPKGSCEEVIHSVITMKKNAALTRVICTGIVDADGRTTEEKAYLKSLNINVLPVSEVENLFLIPSVTRAIGIHEALREPELTERIETLNQAIIDNVRSGGNLEAAVARYCRRRIDNALKKIDLSTASSAEEIGEKFVTETEKLDITTIATAQRQAINACLASNDIEGLLALYDNKGLLSLAARHLKATKLDEFKSWLVRSLNGRNAPGIAAALATILPDLSPS